MISEQKLTRDQQRAAHALKKVQEIEKQQEVAQNYRSYAEGLPASILMNGLGQACATLLAQAGGKDDAHRLLYNHLEDWLCAGQPYASRDLLQEIMKNGQDKYVHAQAEALAYLVWLKKLAQAYLPKKGNQNDGQEKSG